jgi:hypothetical protein
MLNLTRFPGKVQMATSCSHSKYDLKNVLNARMGLCSVITYSLNTIVSSNYGPST